MTVDDIPLNAGAYQLHQEGTCMLMLILLPLFKRSKLLRSSADDLSIIIDDPRIVNAPITRSITVENKSELLQMLVTEEVFFKRDANISAFRKGLEVLELCRGMVSPCTVSKQLLLSALLTC